MWGARFRCQVTDANGSYTNQLFTARAIARTKQLPEPQPEPTLPPQIELAELVYRTSRHMLTVNPETKLTRSTQVHRCLFCPTPPPSLPTPPRNEGVRAVTYGTMSRGGLLARGEERTDPCAL